MTFDANAIFEDELTRRGLTFVRDSEHEYRIDVDGREISATLYNGRRNAERDDDPDAIRRFVDHVTGLARSPATWEDAAQGLLFAAEPLDQEFGDTIRSQVTDTVCRVLTWADGEQSRIVWVTPKMCEGWGVRVEDALAAATANQERLLDGIELEVAQRDDGPLGMVPVSGPYKASVIFARSFQQFVEPVLGWPVLVVIPCRDFLYVVSDDSPLVGRMGSVVVKEFRESGYPITTEVLRVSDDGIEAIGHFPA